MNAINFQIIDEIVDVLDIIDLDDEVIPVIITGARKILLLRHRTH